MLSLALVVSAILAQTPVTGGIAFPGDGAISVNAQNVHDPTVVAFKGRYLCFSTSGDGFGVLRTSKDLKTWKVWGPILPEFPRWLSDKYRTRSLWAPDVVVLGDKLRMYYSVSGWGTNRSVIGLAECENFDPDQPQKGWRDLGLVIESRPDQETYNAIDPEVIVTPEGEHWMFFGSYFAGIQLVELDPATGKLKAPDHPSAQCVARNTEEKGNPLEGAAVGYRDGYYYLFVSYGLAAQGVRSTYRMMVGRSRTVTGPYLDQAGRSMVEGGHTTMLKTSPPMFSPGHSDFFRDEKGTWWTPYHFYDGRRKWHGDVWGMPTLQIREVIWSRDGWPLPGLPTEFARKAQKHESPVGKWWHQVDFGDVDALEFRANGTAVHGEDQGRWEAKGDDLVVRWPKRGQPNQFWIDRLTLAYGGGYYVGRNDTGVVIRGIRVEMGGGK